MQVRNAETIRKSFVGQPLALKISLQVVWTQLDDYFCTRKYISGSEDFTCILVSEVWNGFDRLSVSYFESRLQSCSLA
jgi:hypothetical protein